MGLRSNSLLRLLTGDFQAILLYYLPEHVIRPQIAGQGWPFGC